MSLVVPSRRGFIGGLVGLIAAPAVVRVDSLMKISVPKPEKPKGGPFVGDIYVNVNNMMAYVWDGVAWMAMGNSHSSGGERVHLPVTDMKRAEITDFMPRPLTHSRSLEDIRPRMAYMGQGFNFPNIVRAT